MAITVTEKAAAEVRKVLEEQKLDPGTFLRVGIAGGGCSGFNYTLGFDTAFDAQRDAKFEFHGVPVVVDKKRALYLDHTTVDWFENGGRRGFTFDNPDEIKTCGGCGGH